VKYFTPALYVWFLGFAVSVVVSVGYGYYHDIKVVKSIYWRKNNFFIFKKIRLGVLVFCAQLERE
jgi:hypothetical protein